MNGYTAVQRRDRSDQWMVAAGELPDEQMQQNNNKTILSNNNNNSWAVKSLIVEMIRQPVRGEEGGENITLHYALRRPNASNVFCSAELPAWDPWQGVPCVASWAI